MARTYAKVFFDWRKQMAALSDAERGRLYDAILEYGETGIVPELGGRESILFPVFQSQLDRDMKSYQNKVSGAAQAREARSNHSDNSDIRENRSNHSDEWVNQRQEEEKEEEEKDIYPPPPSSSEDCAERKNLPSAPPSAPPVICLPLVDKTMYEVTEADVALWADAYPNTDVISELRRMVVWLDANPTRKKTRGGIKRFVVSWLRREQDKGGYRGGGYQAGAAPQLTPEEEAVKEAFLRERC